MEYSTLDLINKLLAENLIPDLPMKKLGMMVSLSPDVKSSPSLKRTLLNIARGNLQRDAKALGYRLVGPISETQIPADIFDRGRQSERYSLSARARQDYIVEQAIHDLCELARDASVYTTINRDYDRSKYQRETITELVARLKELAELKERMRG